MNNLPPHARRSAHLLRVNTASPDPNQGTGAVLTDIDPNTMSAEALQKVSNQHVQHPKCVLTKHQAFRDQQLEINTMRVNENNLRRRLADTENAENGEDEDGEPQRKRKRGKKAKSSDDGEKYISQVNHLAHKYVILFGLWMREGKGTFTVDVDPTYADSGRFDSSESKIQGQLTDLLEMLPEMLKSTVMLESEWLPERVSSVS